MKPSKKSYSKQIFIFFIYYIVAELQPVDAAILDFSTLKHV